MEAVLIYYFLGINMVTLCVFGLDKWKAKYNAYRISEKSLLQLTIAGGWIGAIMGMERFRHKTTKTQFLRKFRTIVLVEASIAGLWWRYSLK